MGAIQSWPPKSYIAFWLYLFMALYAAKQNVKTLHDVSRLFSSSQNHANKFLAY